MISRMEKERTWQLCRTGVFGADGARITERDLEEIRETFSPPRPVTVGHDGSDRFPKFGDVTDIVGIYPDERHPGEKVLVGKVVLRPELARVFSDGGAGGLYSGWSVTIPRRASDGKRYLHSLAVCGAVPPTGLPLPFVSAGGSSLVFYLAAVGMLLAVSRRCSARFPRPLADVVVRAPHDGGGAGR